MSTRSSPSCNECHRQCWPRSARFPIFAWRGERAWSESREEGLRRSIAERKGRLYTGIIELDFDRDSGKISPEDHERMRSEAMSEVVALLKEEEAFEKGPRTRPAVRRERR